jgi:hypothetical protein
VLTGAFYGTMVKRQLMMIQLSGSRATCTEGKSGPQIAALHILVREVSSKGRCFLPFLMMRMASSAERPSS